MRLLLDEMHSPAVAARLRERGHDVVAVKERPELIGLPDTELLAATTADGRAVVTENIKDLARLDRSMAVQGRHHAGLVLTLPRRFNRGAPGHVETLTTALDAFLRTEAQILEDTGSFTWWLATGDAPAG